MARDFPHAAGDSAGATGDFSGAAGSGLGPVGQEIVLENGKVRIWHIQLEPGETQPLHHHGLAYVVVAVQGAKNVIHTADGQRIDVVEEAGGVVFREPGQTHKLTNVGDTTYIGRIVELKTGS